MMTDLCMYFQIHQPHRMRKYTIFDIGKNPDYFDDNKNREVMEKVAKKCYLPATQVLIDNALAHPGRFKCAFSITGVALDQMEKSAPEVISKLQELNSTGCVEFLGETYYHSLSYLFNKDEFRSQVESHDKKIQQLFGQKPQVFRNTELIYYNELASVVESMGYKAILAEGADHVLGWRSPNFVYHAKTTKGLKLLLKNYKLSDDIAFRFSQRTWEGWPLTASKFIDWAHPQLGDSINLFMDYETFGEHQWEDTGIFEFMRHMPAEALSRGMGFKKPSELLAVPAKDEIDMHTPVSWADVERDTSAWLGNKMQDHAAAKLYSLREAVIGTGDARLIEDWRKLTTSDHFYYMCTKWFNDGDVHKYFNPYETPYESYIAFMNILQDLQMRCETIDHAKTISAEAQSQAM